MPKLNAKEHRNYTSHQENLFGSKKDRQSVTKLLEKFDKKTDDPFGLRDPFASDDDDDQSENLGATMVSNIN